MVDNFQYDVFLSHSSKDKEVAHAIAEQLQANGLRVWFNDWRLADGDSIPAKIEEGLEHSRVLVLCMSANVTGSEWTQLEAGTFRFRDPLNKERRFIPLRLDDSPIKGSLAQFLCIDWLPRVREVASVKISASSDKTLRLWDFETGRCLRVLEGHTGAVRAVAWSIDQLHVLSGSMDSTVRLWDVTTGSCRALKRRLRPVMGVAWGTDGRLAYSGHNHGRVRVWDVSALVGLETSKLDSPAVPAQVQYTNAKVLLVGDSGAGKTGLSKRLALNDWQPSDSTVGVWATQWKLPVSSGDGVEREIWLWDFGGQADQRLIHQLYMDETALAILVFDGQKEDLFETLGQWDRDLMRASRQTFSKLLVAGRVDAGGLRISRTQIEAFRNERGYLRLLETSAKFNLGCDDLKQAILEGIRWDEIPWRSSPLLFKRLKEEIIRLKDSGRSLMRFNELRETLQLRLLEEKSGKITGFTDDELKAVVSLLAGPGVVWELKFGRLGATPARTYQCLCPSGDPDDARR